MCLIKGAFVGEKNLDVIKMHGKTIKKSVYTLIITRYDILSCSVLRSLFYYAFKVMYTEL
jgi:hypothetical protein